MSQGIPPPLPPAEFMTQRRAERFARTACNLGLLGLLPFLGAPFAVAGVVLGIVALAKRKPGANQATQAIIVGLLGLAIVAPLSVMFGGMLCHAREAGRRAQCMGNLHSIDRCIVMYLDRHDDVAPQDFEAMIRAGEPAETFQCPSGKNPSHQYGYFYLPPAKDTDPNAIMVCDFAGNHEGLRNVLYVDSHVGRLSEAEFQKALAEPRNAAFAAALRMVEKP